MRLLRPGLLLLLATPGRSASGWAGGISKLCPIGDLPVGDWTRCPAEYTYCSIEIPARAGQFCDIQMSNESKKAFKSYQGRRQFQKLAECSAKA
jgi:hypothetical protein